MDICCYNVQGYIHKLETLQRYEYPFERLKHIKKEYEENKEEEKKEEEEEKKLEEITE